MGDNMKIFSKDLIKIGVQPQNKQLCLDSICQLFYEKGVISSVSDYSAAMWTRENTMSTGIGKGIAIPHGRSGCVRDLRVALYILKTDLDFEAIDDQPVKIIFMMAVPENNTHQYMQLLGAISKTLRDDSVRVKLLNCTTIDEIYQIIKGIEDEI